jgi:hypothetical protein
MAEAPHAHVVHHTHDRVRVRIPEKRHDESFFSDTAHRLARKMPEAHIETNPATASVLVTGPNDPWSLLKTLGGDSPFQLGGEDDSQTPRFEQVRDKIKGFNDWFLRQSGGSRDARWYVFLVLIISAIYQLARGEIFAPAATLFWYAGEALRVWTPETTQQNATQGAQGP